MQKLFILGVRLMDRLRYRGKFTTIAVLFLVPLALLTFYFNSGITADVNFAKNEQRGQSYVDAVEKFMIAADKLGQITVEQKARGKAAEGLEGARTEFRAAFEAVKASHEINGQVYGDGTQWEALAKAVDSVQAKGDAMGGHDAMSAFSDVQDRAVDLVGQIASSSQLILDPQGDTYFAMDSFVTQWPILLQKAGELRSVAELNSSKRKLALADRTEVTVAHTQFTGADSALTSDLSSLKGFNANASQALEQSSKPMDDAAQKFAKLVSDNFVSAEPAEVTVDKVAADANDFCSKSAAYRDSASAKLSQLLGKRVSGLIGRRLVVLSTAALCIALAGYFFAGFYYSTKRSIGALVETTSQLNGDFAALSACAVRMAEGDLTRSVGFHTEPPALSTHDEIGMVGKALADLTNSARQTAEAFTESQSGLILLIMRLQQNSTEVMSASEQLGGLAASVGDASEHIQRSMSEVTGASAQAAKGTTEIATGAVSQARSLAESSNRLTDLVTEIQGVASSAVDAVNEARRAAEIAENGGRVVEESLKSMEAIRAAVARGSEVIDHLGASSDRIGMIVKTISDIAEQTNLLALNAAIEAARAGESGRGFAVVAEEVRKLAERSARATLEIQELITSIQGQTSEAVKAMRTGNEMVGAQAEIAHQTGDGLAEIVSAFDRLNARIETINGGAEKMSRDSEVVKMAILEATAVVEESSAAAEELSASAEEVSASIETVAMETSRQASAAEQLISAASHLKDLSEAMRESALKFTTDKDSNPPLKLAA